MEDKEENLYHHIKRLDLKEKAVLMNILRRKPGWEGYHIGHLPMLPHRDAVVWASFYQRAVTHSLLLERILRKIATTPPQTQTILKLNSGKVYRRFGKHPERGVVLPGLASIHRTRQEKPEFGFSWERRNFEKKADAYDVQQQVVELRCIGHNRWAVSCAIAVQSKVVEWLERNLGG